MSSARSDKTQSPLPNTPLGRYWVYTHRPLNCLAMVTPFLLAYEIGIAIAGTDLLARHQIGYFLDQLGASAVYLPAMLVAGVLLAWQLFSREKWKISGPAVATMFVEAFLWSLPLMGLGLLSQQLMMAGREAAALAAGAQQTQDLLAGIGGGVYEEFIFRLVGLNLFTLLLVDVLELPKGLGLGISVAACALLFSGYHFVGAKPFNLMQFLFYAVAGVYLAGVFLLRGFGVAIGTHVFYNLLVVLWKITG